MIFQGYNSNAFNAFYICIFVMTCTEYIAFSNQKKRDPRQVPLKKSYAGLRGVWIAKRILLQLSYAFTLLLVLNKTRDYLER